MDDDLNRRVAIEVMEWEWKKPWGTDKFSWFDGGVFHHDFYPKTEPAMCDLAIRKMQSDGWTYERRYGHHIFEKGIKGPVARWEESVPYDPQSGFDCPGICEAMLKAKEAERG